MLIIRGQEDLRKAGILNLHRRTADIRFNWKEFSQSWSETSKKFPNFKTAPTLLTRISIPLNVSCVLLKNSLTPSALERSVAKKMCPEPLISFSKESKCSVLREQPATCAPSFANARARALPIPSAAPVTITFRFFKEDNLKLQTFNIVGQKSRSFLTIH